MLRRLAVLLSLAAATTGCAGDAEIELEENGVRRREILRDTIWLVRVEDAWRAAKLSAVAHRASLGPPLHIEDDEPTAAPDLAAGREQFALHKAAFARRMREREAAYRQPGGPAECRGGTAVEDPAGDLVHNAFPSSGPVPDMPSADLRRVTAAPDGDRRGSSAARTTSGIRSQSMPRSARTARP